MSIDDRIKAGKESRAFGPDSDGYAVCTCGRTFQAFSSGRDLEDYWDGSRPPYGPDTLCSECRYAGMRAQIKDAEEAEARREFLRHVARPSRSKSKLEPQAFREACEEWLGARQPLGWRPAWIRNRCKEIDCGQRTADRFLRMCAICRDAHRRRCLRHELMDLPRIRHPDLLVFWLKWSVAQEHEFQPLHDYIAKEASCRK